MPRSPLSCFLLVGIRLVNSTLIYYGWELGPHCGLQYREDGTTPRAEVKQTHINIFAEMFGTNRDLIFMLTAKGKVMMDIGVK